MYLTTRDRFLLMIRRLFGTLAGCGSALVTAGCYGYYATPNDSHLVGRRVQVALTDSGSVVLAPQIGPARESLEGRLVGDSGGVYVMSVLSTRKRDGDETDWRGERLTIARPLVTEIAERRFSFGRTALASVLGTVAFVAAQQAFSGRGGTSGGGLPTKPGSK